MSLNGDRLHGRSGNGGMGVSQRLGLPNAYGMSETYELPSEKPAWILVEIEDAPKVPFKKGILYEFLYCRRNVFQFSHLLILCIPQSLLKLPSVLSMAPCRLKADQW